jgi:hypothetical protein
VASGRRLEIDVLVAPPKQHLIACQLKLNPIPTFFLLEHFPSFSREWDIL